MDPLIITNGADGRAGLVPKAQSTTPEWYIGGLTQPPTMASREAP